LARPTAIVSSHAIIKTARLFTRPVIIVIAYVIGDGLDDDRDGYPSVGMNCFKARKVATRPTAPVAAGGHSFVLPRRRRNWLWDKFKRFELFGGDRVDEPKLQDEGCSGPVFQPAEQQHVEVCTCGGGRVLSVFVPNVAESSYSTIP